MYMHKGHIEKMYYYVADKLAEISWSMHLIDNYLIYNIEVQFFSDFTVIGSMEQGHPIMDHHTVCSHRLIF